LRTSIDFPVSMRANEAAQGVVPAFRLSDPRGQINRSVRKLDADDYFGSRFVNLRSGDEDERGFDEFGNRRRSDIVSDRVLRFLERVEHRIARTDCEREAAFQLRYDAYVEMT